MAEFESLEGDDRWDGEFAEDLVGCTLLVGLTYVDHDNQLLRRQQVFGTVVSVDRQAGILVRQETGDDFTVAPVLDAIEPAQPGIYQLADEDAAVEDPDFTALLTVRAPLRS
ncbi:hypothetical protein [Sphingomonas aerophila]|uniref:Uncharacterized protein n=1 Tax=Sphingomonas aerophila TaxID=1344948 RepID=A0A7W9B9S0_9SPHN|nr:hypothetical protein [Sphingomonas aerophila]MBB5713217.1 hypothetical protein [Sphingomonas aerophila]